MFLKAMALGLSLPVAAHLARVATAAPGTAPKRFFVFYMPHGIPPEHYNPRVMGGDRTQFSLDKSNLSILGPLEPYKQYVNVYQGFQYKGKADTHEGIINCLSGFDKNEITTNRTTVEHVIAKGLGVKPLILGACSRQPFGLNNNGMLFWDGRPVDPEKSPVKAADALFGGNAGATPAPTPVSADIELRKELLALTASEVQGLHTQLSRLTAERTKLETHLTAIQGLQTQAGGHSGQSNCSTKPMLPAVEMVRAASAGQIVDSSGGNDYFYQEKNFPLLLQAQLEVVAQALICNAAQVIGLMPMYATCDFDFTFAGAPGSHHNGLSHTGPQAVPTAQYNSPVSIDNLQAAVREPFARAQLWFTQQLVKNVVSVLAATDDPAAPGTKVLDNTIIYCMSEVADGQNHNRISGIQHPQFPSQLPLITIGKGGGALRSGQVFEAPAAKLEDAAALARPATDIYLTLARAMGVGTATFPDTTGPINEVLA